MLFFVLAFAGMFLTTTISGQAAKLSFQGILKKSNGIAVDDGVYALTFNLYESQQGGTAIWTETQENVDLSGGIYSVFLGDVNPLSVPFDTTYYLGVKVGGSSELLPRFRLTSAPYALSLIGESNIFPSSGVVQADDILISNKVAIGGGALPATHTLQVNGGILAEGGAPGENGADNNGYAFKGNSGDEDSGLFSTADGEVSLFANNQEKLKANSEGVTVSQTLHVGDANTAGEIKLSKNGTISYDGLNDWRLVLHDNFETGHDGWLVYDNQDNNANSSNWGRFNGAGYGATRFNVPGPIVGYHLISPDNRDFLSKEYDLTGKPHSEVKIEFVYVAYDTWDHEMGFAGIKLAPNDQITGAWSKSISFLPGMVDFGSGGVGETMQHGTIEIKYAGDKFYLVFGSYLDSGVDNEQYGIANIKIWVR